jgi:hypothetical protein
MLRGIGVRNPGTAHAAPAQVSTTNSLSITVRNVDSFRNCFSKYMLTRQISGRADLGKPDGAVGKQQPSSKPSNDIDLSQAGLSPLRDRLNNG